jgi:hypothetical protein
MLGSLACLPPLSLLKCPVPTKPTDVFVVLLSHSGRDLGAVSVNRRRPHPSKSISTPCRLICYSITEQHDNQSATYHPHSIINRLFSVTIYFILLLLETFSYKPIGRCGISVSVKCNISKAVPLLPCRRQECLSTYWTTEIRSPAEAEDFFL